MAWDMKTHPYVVRWSHPTGDRLTRFTETVEFFATENEAIQAINKPFPKNTSDAHVIRFERIGFGPMIAKRKRGEKLRLI